MLLTIQNGFLEVIKNVWFNPPLLIYILMHTVKKFHRYSVLVKLDRWVRSCNTLNELLIKICIPNKTEDLNLSDFN